MFGVNDKILIAAQKINSRQIRPIVCLVYGVKVNPLVELSFVGNNLRPKGFVDFIQRDTPISCHDEFLFEPKFFLEVLNLREEIDNDSADALDNFNLGKISFYPRFIVGIQILQVHDFAFYEEIQFASQELAQIFMDKIIEGILRHVTLEVLFK